MNPKVKYWNNYISLSTKSILFKMQSYMCYYKYMIYSKIWVWLKMPLCVDECVCVCICVCECTAYANILGGHSESYSYFLLEPHLQVCIWFACVWVCVLLVHLNRCYVFVNNILKCFEIKIYVRIKEMFKCLNLKNNISYPSGTYIYIILHY